MFSFNFNQIVYLVFSTIFEELSGIVYSSLQRQYAGFKIEFTAMRKHTKANEIERVKPYSMLLHFRSLRIPEMPS